MKKWLPPLLVWMLSAGLWLIVAVDRSAGDTDSIAVGSEPAVLPENVPAADSFAAPVASPVDSCINVNSATAEQLDALPGIGPVIAARVVAYREGHGPFKRLADIERVKGIGPATIKKFGSMVCF